MRRIVFITGTGTGVGKTVLTALLLSHLRQEGRDALAMKPFCSGSREDARLLCRLQKRALMLDEINPFFFQRALAPWVDAKDRGVAQVALPKVLGKIREISRRSSILLVEGSGGVLVPLGEGYGVGELIARIGSKTLVVARNCLGTINHTLLTVKYLQGIGVKDVAVVMMGQRRPDLSSKGNVEAVRALAPGVPVYLLPYLGDRASNVTVVKQNAKYLKKILARVWEGGNLTPVPSNRKGDLQQ